jgi:hypothetical protein
MNVLSDTGVLLAVGISGFCWIGSRLNLFLPAQDILARFEVEVNKESVLLVLVARSNARQQGVELTRLAAALLL